MAVMQQSRSSKVDKSIVARQAASDLNDLLLRPNRAMLEEFDRIQTERKALQRQADALEKAEKLMAPALKAYAESKGGSVSMCGFVIELTSGDVRPSWKDEFIRQCGSQAAIEVISATKPGTRLNVRRG